MHRTEVRIPRLNEWKQAPENGSDSQVERATSGLRALLLRGEFQPGQRIAEIPLSARLGVSRTPLRLALERLEHEGLLEALPNSGFAAREFTVKDIWDAIEARGVIEGAATRLIAEQYQQESQLLSLREIVTSIDEILQTDLGKHYPEYLALNESFHATIMRLCPNGALRRTFEQLCAVPFVLTSGLDFLYANVPPAKDIVRVAQEHHRAIAEAIENREGARAESVAREHCRLLRRNVDLALGNQSLLHSVPGGRLINFRNAKSV